MQIAVADDETEIAQEISSHLINEGLNCDTFRNGDEVVAGLRRSTYDVVLLDWNMPGKTGVEVIEWATENLEKTPNFIIMTSRSDPEDVVRGLEAGACDFIVKPEHPSVVLARVQAAARRSIVKSPDPVMSLGPYTIDRNTRTATLNDEEIKLTAKEFDLVRTFFENLDRPLSRNYLLAKVWGGSDQLETRTLDMHVSRIRSKLRLRPENGVVIQTVFGFGYRMNNSEG